MSQLKQAKNIIAELLTLMPAGACHMFHHSEKERHGIHDECPPLSRYMAKIKTAREFIQRKGGAE